MFCQIFQWIGPLVDSVIELQCQCVCVSVTIQNTHFRVSWRLLVEGYIANIGLQWHNFMFCSVLLIFWVFQLFRVLGASLLWARLLWIMGELAGGGSVAVAVGVSERWHMTRDTPRMTHDTWHRHQICDKRHMILSVPFWLFLFFLVSVLLSAHVKKFSVSHVQNLFYYRLGVAGAILQTTIQLTDWWGDAFPIIILKSPQA